MTVSATAVRATAVPATAVPATAVPATAVPATSARSESRWAGGDRGVATVWAAGVIAVLMSLTVFGLHLGGVILARHHAQSAADLAALAGAGSAVAGERPACSRARAVTDRMRVRLVACSVRGWDVLVQVAARPGGPLGGLGEATGQARAGPVGH